MGPRDMILAVLPLLVINLGLVAICLVDWLRRTSYRVLNKWTWLAVFVLVQIIGPVLYLVLGRSDEE